MALNPKPEALKTKPYTLRLSAFLVPGLLVEVLGSVRSFARLMRTFGAWGLGLGVKAAIGPLVSTSQITRVSLLQPIT